MDRAADPDDDEPIDPNDEGAFEADADEPIDFSEIDPEAWRDRIPRLPPISLAFALVALPVISLLVRGTVAERVGTADPDQAWLVDVWGALIDAALVAGALLVVLVPAAARIARGRERLIFALLERGFPIGVVLVSLVILLHAGLAVALLLAVEWLIFGQAFPATAALLLLGGLASATYLAATGLSALREEPSQEVAVTLDPDAAPRLHDTIDALATRIGVPAPTAVLLGPTMEFWTGTGTFATIDGSVRGTVIYVSIPQMALLSVPQVESILAHELAHVRQGDTDVGARMTPAYNRIAKSIETLEVESRGLARIAATPALLWLGFARDAVGVVVGELRRASEAAADLVAAEITGPEHVAEGLIAGHAIGVIEDGWVNALGRAVEAGQADPVETRPVDAGQPETGDPDPIAAFVREAREAFADVSTEDVLVQSLGDIGPSHPALLTRIRAVGQPDARFALTDDPALARLIAQPDVQLQRLLDALAPRDLRREELELNLPRVTPGAIGWLVAGLVLGVIVTYRWVTATGPLGDLPLIAGGLVGLWLLFPIVYPWLQREVVIDARGVRMRPWWWRWLDADADRLSWSRLRWTDTVSLDVGFENILTLSNGSERLRWWAGLWPKGELARLFDALRDRGAYVEFTSAFGEADVERHAVVYFIDGTFIVPELRRHSDGSLVEVRPVKSFGAGMLKLSFALIDRLHDPVEPLNEFHTVVDLEHLAALAKVDPGRFEDDAQRMTIFGSREAWTIAIDGRDGEWMVDRSVDKSDLDDVIFDILGLEKTVRAPRRKKGPAREDEPPPESAT